MINMSRYLKSKIRIIRKLGKLPGFTKKKTTRTNRPGENASKFKDRNSEYLIRLEEKQKLRFNYGISESQLYNLIKKARKINGATGLIVLQLLEMRLDNIIYRLGFTSTIPESRQIINHSHILVNNKLVNIPSFQCKKGDFINIKPKSKLFIINKLTPVTLPNFLKLDKKTLQGTVQSLVERDQIELIINELLVIECYSRR
jgi:small subunit ribosomal protein S4